MKKLLIPVIILLTGCSVQNYDDMYDYKYDYAECYLNGSKRKYEISSWRYYKDGIVEITTTNADMYMLSMSYCKLVRK